MATGSAKSDELALRWSGRLSLTARILAVNVFALALLAGGFFYLDSYRSRLIDQRRDQAAREVALAAQALALTPAPSRAALLERLGRASGARLRLYGPTGAKAADSWSEGPPTYRLRDPASDPWQRRLARFLDRVFDAAAGAAALPPFAEPAIDSLAAWPEAAAAPATAARYAPDRTPVLSASAALPNRTGVVLLTENARDITRVARAERYRLGILLAMVTLVSIWLSLFLARTIVQPLRKLARAAIRVRRGRAREVEVPRLPSRRDEIGSLARALADMSAALNQRIDSIEAFAADVTHELKNPLASLRSAVETLRHVKEPNAQAQLLAIVDDDVRRLDRLITDIAEASRLDAQVSRAAFAPVDLGALIEDVVRQREARATDAPVALAFARPSKGSVTVQGDAARLARVIENLIDNAVSFSPPRGLVRIDATRAKASVRLSVEDEGPGVPPEARAKIFARFHSDRPDAQDFGRHSGLGLAIAKTIVDGHGGVIAVEDARGVSGGARFVVSLPASGDAT